MDSTEFAAARKRLNKTQQEMARLLGSSIKAVHSYEQGWRNIPPHAERQILFLLVHAGGAGRLLAPCWEILGCPEERKSRCPAWEFRVGALCWFINGTICGGEARKSWEEKMRMCRSCRVLEPYLPRVDSIGGI
ncbi:MAG: transcriptional regulator [Deltaproteobacteria bacterium]|nr:transcriptional regulator [Deltaproteobacteria bacterium]